MRTFKDQSELITGFPLDHVIVFDTETTGLEPNRDEVLSISIIDGYDNVLMNTLVKPSRKKKWPDAERVNRISPRMVKDAPTMAELIPAIRSIMTPDKLIVGYNTPFDIGFLVAAGALDSYPENSFDVMREFSGGSRWVKLTECAAHYGLKFNAHSSIEDTKATAYCYRSLVADPSYVSRALAPRIEALRRVKTAQTAKTKLAIAQILADRTSLQEQATLVLGQMASGVNKGMPRYECYVNGVLVGQTNTDATYPIREYLCLSIDEPLPESIPATAMLSSMNGSITCRVSMNVQSPLLGFVQTSSPTPAPIAGYQPASSYPASSKSIGSLVVGILLALLAALFLLSALSLLFQGNVGSFIAGVVMAAIPGWFAWKRFVRSGYIS
ncbi:3'-5' exonuclease [Slackia exigua]|uniref:3'-5' exonuclease n=1 Tax=Slackia exigua TaxID=84109 RepID=UPI0023EFB88D|nr:3'-5' exonuclease [Slackia exigua]